MKATYIKSWGNPEKMLAFEEENSFPRGNGQSYGDTSLNFYYTSSKKFQRYELDAESGVLIVGSGVSVGELLSRITPHGWILPVVPGSSSVTIGGAIASDVHGKNHFSRGCFSEHLLALKLKINQDEIITYPGDALFKATCGGIGLTGIILEAKIQLQKIQNRSWVEKQTRYMCIHDLARAMARSEASFSNGWIDSVSLNRCVLTEIYESDLNPVAYKLSSQSIDWKLDIWNSVTQLVFNSIYFSMAQFKVDPVPVSLKQSLFPLEKIVSWNNLCGNEGLLQLHVAVSTIDGLDTLLGRIKASKIRPLLISLKKFSRQNQNYFSFPQEGFGIAIDFKKTLEAQKIVKDLIDLVLEFQGKIYLSKDQLMSETQFKQMYPAWKIFQEVRASFGANNRYTSLQSRRLGLD